MKKNVFFNMAYGVCLYGLSHVGIAQQAVQASDQETTRIHTQAKTHQSTSQQENIEELVVVAHPLAKQGLSQSASVLHGGDLDKNISASLGETVSSHSGVNTSSFGFSVGRPIIHGLSGARVKTTQDRIDSMDVAVSSADHAVALEPFIADQITILKGASTLLYGSNAIGGVVDVSSGRIHSKLPAQEISGKVELRAQDMSDAYSAAFRIDGSNGDSFSWHVDGFKRDSDDYDIPVSAESSALASLHEHEEEEHDDEDNVLLGSRFENQGGAVGVSWFFDQAFVSLSLSRLEAEYGLIGHGHEEDGHDEDGHDEDGHDEDEHDEDEHDEDEHDEDEHDEDEHQHAAEPGLIDLEQTRVDLAAGISLQDSVLDAINFRMGFSDYTHQEMEPEGEFGTRFENDQLESRLEFSHSELLGFEGVFGVQYNVRDFSAIGEEAFVEPVDSRQFGVFWVAEKPFAFFDFETGLRVEHVRYSPSGEASVERSFSSGSASIGFLKEFNSRLRAALQLDYTTRAPSIEELYANGAHLATSSFEVGDTRLDTESAVALSLSLNYRGAFFDANSTVYHMDFDDFIYQEKTGAMREALPVFQYKQDAAKFTGLDVNAAIHLGRLASGDVDVRLLFDTVRARLSQGSNRNLPRIPASRIGVGLDWESDNWKLSLDYKFVSSQTDLAEFELRTPSYHDLGIHIQKFWRFESGEISAFIKGSNLFDEEQRHHSSFIKDLAPLPGRYVEAGLRLRF